MLNNLRFFIFFFLMVKSAETQKEPKDIFVSIHILLNYMLFDKHGLLYVK